MMKKPKMGSNEQQASHAVQASESSVQRLHVRLSSTTVFKRKARNISEPHGDLEIAGASSGRCNAVLVTANDFMAATA